MTWPPSTFLEALIATAAFGLIGILLAVLGFKIFDWLTPGNLQKEVLEKNNMAAAVVVASVVIGICIIIAAAVHG